MFAFGDTLVAFVDNGQVVRTIPYLQPGEFDNSPALLSTNPFENRLTDQEALNDAWHDLILGSHERPVLLLMTDAIGRGARTNRSLDRVSMLLDLKDDEIPSGVCR